MWITFAVIAVTIIAYGTEKWSIEGVSLAALVFLLAVFSLVPQNLEQEVTATDLLMGFANPALINIAANDARLNIPRHNNNTPQPLSATMTPT